MTLAEALEADPAAAESLRRFVVESKAKRDELLASVSPPRLVPPRVRTDA